MIDYQDRPKKRELQYKIFSLINCTMFIGLAGPSPLKYLSTVQETKCKKFMFFEQDISVYRIQKKDLKDKNNIRVIYGNINDNLVYNDAFYDLDYCCNITTIESFLPQIAKIQNFSLTVCLRKCSGEKTISIFKKYIKQGYIVKTYKDKNHAPMMVFFKYN